jgi:hypothetical protein
MVDVPTRSSQNEDEASTVATTESVDLDGGVGTSIGSKRQMSSALMALLVAITAMAYLTFFFVRTIASVEAVEDASDRLDASVLRVMIADELGIDKEIDAASNNLDNLLSIFQGKEQRDRSHLPSSLVESAAKLKTALDSGDRKTAIQELANFRIIMNETQAQAFRGPTKSSSTSVVPIIIVTCIIGQILAMIYLFWSAEISKKRELGALKDHEVLLTQAHQQRSAYEAERLAATELRQKLIDQTKLIKSLESRLKASEDSHSSLTVDSKQREAALTQKSASLFDQLQKAEIAKNDAVAESVRFRQQIEDLMKARDDGLKALEESREQARNAAVQVKKLETDNSMIEWSNVKLKSQADEMAAELQKLKLEMEVEAKRFRDQLAALR